MSDEYLLANEPSELERLQLQSLVWEPAGRQLLSKIDDGSGGRALDVGCGALGRLRILSEWVGPSGQDNGGPVQTVAPLAGSPALDQVPATGSACATTDARGVPRPSPAGGMCDIGAVEIAPPARQPVSATVVAGQASQLQLACADLAGAPFTFSLLSQPAHGTLSAFDAAMGRVT